MPLTRHVLFLLLILLTSCTTTSPKPPVIPEAHDVEVEDIRRIPQDFAALPAAANVPSLAALSTKAFAEAFTAHFFKPWTSRVPIFPPADAKKNMKQKAAAHWLGVNRRPVPRKLLNDLLDNCGLDTFPSQNEAAIAVAPGHLRELPTYLPLYTKSEGPPFDQIAYPQVKLNEPLRVLHVSRDGAWVFVVSPYSDGWLERRNVALVDQPLIKEWMEAPHLVLVKDHAAVSDGRGIGTYQCKIGTLLPLLSKEEKWWEVVVASAGDGGKAVTAVSRIATDAAAHFPVKFDKENVVLIGNQLMGQPYGWGEIYGLRDCSALLRDFFIPFGIWLPRTASEQIDTAGERIKVAHLPAPEKESLLKRKGLPFLTLLYKPGHIMLYVGQDREGEPLAFHGSWSILVKDNGGERTQIIGKSAITTLHPGKELGLVAGTSLLEKVTDVGIIASPQ